jgi:hypothetical protein
LNEQDVINRLREAIHAAGSQKSFARQHHVSLQYVNDVLHRRREPGQKILDALGIERVVSYREKQDDNSN